MTLVVDVRVLTETTGPGAALAQSLCGAALLAEAVNAAAGTHWLLTERNDGYRYSKNT